MRKRRFVLFAAVAVFGLVGAQIAGAAGLRGNVMGVDPSAIQTGDTLTVEIILDTDPVGSVSFFEGHFGVQGGTIDGTPTLRFGIPDITAFQTVAPTRLDTSQQLTVTPGMVAMLNLPLVVTAGPGGFLQIDVLVDTIAGTDGPSGNITVLEATQTSPLDLFFEGGSLGGSLSVVPEPGTVFLLGLGLTSLAFYGRRRNREE